jgi:hypothetical protein
MNLVIHFSISIVLAVAIFWGSLALLFDGPRTREIALALAIAYAVSSFACLVFLRPRNRAYSGVIVLLGLILLWWWSLEPSNDREWQADVAMVPRANITNETVTIQNIRNFYYRSETDFDERWETRKYDLSAITGLDLFVIYWGIPSIAHTILSWQFESGPNLAISIETRKEVGEHYSALRGFFRQYELYYVFSDERDVIALRTNHRNEDVYLYRLRTPPKRAKEILLNYLATANQLVSRPKWYNALTDNCTNTIRFHANYGVYKIPFDWRWLASGYLDELLYENNAINHSMTFAVLKLASHINDKAKVAPLEDFSAAIRIGLPPRPNALLN